MTKISINFVALFINNLKNVINILRFYHGANFSYGIDIQDVNEKDILILK